MDKDFYVYMLASKKNGTIYKGMTSNLVGRIADHRNESASKFTKTYNVKNLVWYKHCGTWEESVKWEKRLRGYSRQWKINLIEQNNPRWDDLWDEITGSHGRAM